MNCHVAFFSNAAKERILTFRQQSLSNNSYSIIWLAGGGGTSRSLLRLAARRLISTRRSSSFWCASWPKAWKLSILYILSTAALKRRMVIPAIRH